MDVRVPQRWEKINRRPGVWIRLHGPALAHPSYPDHTSLTESEADAIMQWCMEHKCGVRMSFDMWKFKNKQELMLFVLKWC